MERSELGRTGEAAAARYLEERGWRVVARNVRYREGEIDIVAERDGILAFVEVKTRTSHAFGSPAEAVTWSKAGRIRRVAARFLADVPMRAPTVRFDVMEVRGGAPNIVHIENAF